MPPRNPVCPRCGGIRPYRKKYCDSCKVQALKDAAKKYRATAKGKATFRRNLITGRYNLTWEQYETLLETQNQACAICQKVTELHVDHDHACCLGIESCGHCVRGLLCSLCNKGMGLFKDSPERLQSALVYLARGERKP